MRLLIVEDEPVMAGLVSGALQRAGFSLDTAESVSTADALLRDHDYAAVVLDLGLADGDGLALLQALRERNSPVPVLIMTARDTEMDREAGLITGADDYLVKPFDLDQLVGRVRGLLRRNDASLGLDLRFGNAVLHTPTRSLTINSRPVALPPREALLLDVLMRAPGRVVSREVLEQRLSGFDTPASPSAVEILMNRLRKRLQEAGASAVVHTIRGAGYLMTRD